MYNTQILLVFFFYIVGMTAYNTFTKKYPDVLTFIFFIGAIVYKVYLAIQEESMFIILDSFLCLIVTFIILYNIFGAKRGTIGGGDFKLVISIGVLFGTIYMAVFLLVAFVMLVTMALIYKHSVYNELAIENEFQILPTGWIWTLAFAVPLILNTYWYVLVDLLKS